jgi:predicted nucleotidyltransferase
MKNRILQKLREVEEQHNVEILFAVESGSRAWGFASPDSDYDIRFVYKQRKENYLSLWESKDTIQFMTEDDLDGSGWDIKKATLLLAKSNASFLGWLFSPIVYIDNREILGKMKKLAKDNFNPVSGFYHYHSMNKGFNEMLEEQEINLKSFFYAIRTALCANWIIEYGTIPPVYFKKLYNLIVEENKKLLDELIVSKSKTKEAGVTEIDHRLIDLAKFIVSDNNNRKNTVNTQKINRNEFNRFFINEIS